MDYIKLIAHLRARAECFDYDGRPDIACDLEEAAAIIDVLVKSYDNAKDSTSWLMTQLGKIKDSSIKEPPKETGSLQSGEWVHKNAITRNTRAGWVECSNCGRMAFYQQGLGYLETNFCPNCGAKMKDNI